MTGAPATAAPVTQQPPGGGKGDKTVATMVKVELFGFNTGYGYVDSTHYQYVAVLPASKVAEVAGAMEEQEELFNLAYAADKHGGRQIEADDLKECRSFTRPHTAGDYDVHEGILEVPEGFVAVVYEKVAWCTDRNTYYYANIIGGESLKTHYETLAAKYAAAAAAAELA